MSRRRSATLAATLAALVAVAGLQAGTVLASGTGETKMLEWKSMVGVPQAFTAALAPIRGINGGGVPWTVTSAQGRLRTNGHLVIKVDGLVLASTLSNPAPAFKATVSCLTADNMVWNATTATTFPATLGAASAGGGDAMIDTFVDLPDTCIAPIVFVTSATGSWFASTGG